MRLVGRTRFLPDRRGASLVEYLLLVGLVAFVCIAGYTAFGFRVGDKSAAQADCVAHLSDCRAGQDSGDASLGMPSRDDLSPEATQAPSGDEGGGFAASYGSERTRLGKEVADRIG